MRTLICCLAGGGKKIAIYTIVITRTADWRGNRCCSRLAMGWCAGIKSGCRASDSHSSNVQFSLLCSKGSYIWILYYMHTNALSLSLIYAEVCKIDMQDNSTAKDANQPRWTGRTTLLYIVYYCLAWDVLISVFFLSYFPLKMRFFWRDFFSMAMLASILN